jgi:splicing factor U2AF subunit
LELATKYGEIEEMHVCDNVADHLIGNIYVRFKNEDISAKACEDLNNRFYAGTYTLLSD